MRRELHRIRILQGQGEIAGLRWVKACSGLTRFREINSKYLLKYEALFSSCALVAKVNVDLRELIGKY
jgi:hypothetical protein